MQRHVEGLIAHAGERFLDHRIALLRVHLGLHRVDQGVELGVADAAAVEAAVGAGGLGAHQRLERIERVEGRHAPAEHVGAGVVLEDLRDVGGEGDRVELDAQARLGPHADQRLADFLVVDVAVVRAVEGELEAVRVTGLGDQLPRRGGIGARHLVELLGVAVHPGRDHDRRRDRQAAHGDALDRFPIHGQVERAAHPDVLEGVLALDVGVLQLVVVLVEADEDGAHFMPFEHAQRGVLLQARHVLRWQVGDEVDVAGEQGRDARRVGLDRRVDDVGDVALALVPPVRVRRQHQPLVWLPALENVGARAVGVARRVALLLGFRVLHVLRAVLLRPGLAHDAEVGEFAKQHRVGPGEDEIDGVVVDLADLLHAVDVDLHRALRLFDATVGEDYVVGGEWRAVVELDVLAQVEAPLRGRDLLPAGRQRGLDVVLLAVARQRLVDVHHQCDRRGVVLRVRIEGEDVVLRRPSEGCRIDRESGQ